MTPEEQQLLSALAERVRNVPHQQKDPEAEQFIHQLVMHRPDTAYILAQTVIMQDFALRNAETQIQELQRQLSETAPPAQERPGSFLGGLFGRSQSPQPSTYSSGPSGSVPRVNPWGQPEAQPQGWGSRQGAQGGPGGYGQPPQGPMMQPAQQGSFLRGAATTAVGVAGGALLFSGISSMFSGSSLAGTPPTESLTGSTVPNSDQGGLQQADFGGDADFGDDSADFGGGDDYA
jgi:hypothetical protein